MHGPDQCSGANGKKDYDSITTYALKPLLDHRFAALQLAIAAVWGAMIVSIAEEYRELHEDTVIDLKMDLQDPAMTMILNEPPPAKSSAVPAVVGVAAAAGAGYLIWTYWDVIRLALGLANKRR
jgi:hypothetical protein